MGAALGTLPNLLALHTKAEGYSESASLTELSIASLLLLLFITVFWLQLESIASREASESGPGYVPSVDALTGLSIACLLQ